MPVAEYITDMQKCPVKNKKEDMTKLIRKIFIRDYQNTGNRKVRARHGIVAAIGGIIVNLVLFAVKLLIGIFTFSMSVISDAVNNLSDLFSCLVNLVGFKISGKPADKEHPFGHERIEYIAGMIISFVIMVVAVILGYSAVTKLISGRSDTAYNIWAFVILGASVLAKLLLALFYRGMGRAIDSVALKASTQDSLNDAVSTAAVLVAALVQFFVPSVWWLDGAMSLVLACFILWSGIQLTRETASPLVGLPPDSGYVKRIVGDILSREGVLGVHDVICHAYGPTKVFMTLHVEVDGYADIFASHELIDAIELELGKKYDVLLTVHMDPLDTKNEEIPVLRGLIEKILAETDERLTFHDLRLVCGPRHTNVIFDLVVPSGVETPVPELKEEIAQKISELNPVYNTVITVDRDFN